MTDGRRGTAVVVQPDEGPSWWQPVPANGYSEVRLRPGNLPEVGGRLSSGIQVIAPGCFIREHQHEANEEILFFFEGRGAVEVNGESHPIVPGTTCYLGPLNRHRIVNIGEADLKMFWVLMPGGLEDFFAAIGRPRRPGEPAPEPFPRPDDIEAIEARTVFAKIGE